MAAKRDVFPGRLFKMTLLFCKEVPSQVRTQNFIDHLINTLFPIRDNKNLSEIEIEAKWEALKNELADILRPVVSEQDGPCNCIADKFFAEIPVIYTQLLKDADMYTDCDPAASCREEVILCYPGFYAVMIYRFANILYGLGMPVVPRIMCEYAHSKTGIEIHPGATIGTNFYIDHGTGIVIGETCTIGKNVKLYQGVTLGAHFVDKKLSGTKRHPTIEDNVIIYAGATILGGDTVIGHDTIVGGNVWVTESVPAKSVIYHKSTTVVKDAKPK